MALIWLSILLIAIRALPDRSSIGAVEMAPRSKISKLPKAVLEWLDRELVENNYSGYVLLSGEVNRMLEAADADFRVSKTALHRHGQVLERRLAAVRASTDAARQIAEAAPDDSDQRSAAVIGLVQTDIFNTLLLMQEAEGEDAENRLVIMGKAARAIADLSRASVSQKKWQAEVRTRAALAADAVADIASKNGLSSNAMDRIRREILGIAN